MTKIKVTAEIYDFLFRQFPCKGEYVLRYFPDIVLSDKGYDMEKLDWDGCLVSGLRKKINRFYSWRCGKQKDTVAKKALLIVYDIFDEIKYYVDTSCGRFKL